MRIIQSMRIVPILLVLVLGVCGCSEEAIEARGFVLPPGDPEVGEILFVGLQCQQCHTVSGVELPADRTMRDGPALVTLGGSRPTIKTYGDLVTSIINPSHKLVGPREQVSYTGGKSMMTNYNDVMTVQELIDIVAFLQMHYKIEPVPRYMMP